MNSAPSDAAADAGRRMVQDATEAKTDERADEGALVARALAGERAAFERIMRLNNRRLFRAARSILRDDADAEEAVQDAYFTAFRALHAFRGDSRLSTWLTRIAVNEALQRLRKHHRQTPTVPVNNVIELEAALAERTLRRPEDTPEAVALRAETRRLLERNIDALPATYRSVFVLREVEGMSSEETAACLGLTDAAVRTRLTRAKRLLRSALARHMDLAAGEAYTFDGARCDRLVAAVLARVFPG